MKWTREEIIWLAGFFEGEGSISLTEYTHRVHYIFSITSCDKDVLEKVRNIIGFGNFMGPYKRKNRNNKPYWQFQMNIKSQVLSILWAMYPWLGERRQAKIREVSLDFRKIRVDGRAATARDNAVNSSSKMIETRRKNNKLKNDEYMLELFSEKWDCSIEEARKRLAN